MSNEYADTSAGTGRFQMLPEDSRVTLLPTTSRQNDWDRGCRHPMENLLEQIFYRPRCPS